MRIEYKMTEKEYKELMEAIRPVPLIMLQYGMPRSPQACANAAWVRLGKRRGFDGMTVQPVPGKSDRFFTAEVTVPEEEGDDDLG